MELITIHKLSPYPTSGKVLQTIQNILSTNPANHILFLSLSKTDKELAALKLKAYREAFDVLEEKEVDGYIEMRLRCKNKEDLMRWQLQAIKETVEREYQDSHTSFCLKNNINPLTLEELP